MKLFLLSLFTVTCLFAKDLGKTSVEFPIEEEDLAASIKKRIANHQEEIQKYGKWVMEYLQNPTPIPGIGKAMKRQSRLHDPAHTVEEDIVIDDVVLAKAGDKINPLSEMNLPGGLLFFDGSDLAQIAWARKQPVDFKWVLVKGSPSALEEKEKRSVYFDQLSALTTFFQIRNVPAKVAQKGTFLLVEEIPVDEEGEEKL